MGAEPLYQLMIVDDEPIICRGLASLPWADVGYEICGTLFNGEECLRQMEEQSADVIITDIQMPVMDGLELAAAVHSKYPRCRVVLLTGYKSFEYAQSAIKSDVIDYLVKPVDLDELAALMKRLKKELDAERLLHAQMESDRARLTASIPYATETFFKNLFFSRELDLATIEETASLLELSFPYPYYVVLSLEETGSGEQIGVTLSHYGKSHLDAPCQLYFFQNQPGETILLLNFDVPDGQTTTYAYVTELTNHLCEAFRAQFPDAELNIGVSNIYRTILSCSASYTHAREALKQKFFCETQHCFYAWKERSTYASTLTEYPYEAENQLVDAVLMGDRAKTEACFSNFCRECFMQARYSNREDIVSTCQQLLLMLERRCSAQGVSLTDTIHCPPPFTAFFAPMRSLHEMEAQLLSLLCAVTEKFDHINSTLKPASHTAVLQAMEYLRAHYTEKLTLSETAEHVHLNASYLSLQFKNEFGKNFIDILKEYRIEKAKELLKNPDYKIYEICAQVGYSNPNYFADTFKACTGMSPMEYRRKLS